VGLQMPPHPILTEILLKFWVQLHQLTPNAIAQLSKYFWAMLSFNKEPSSEGFAKRYELHFSQRRLLLMASRNFSSLALLTFM
jgi:hypothetical protein